MVLGYFDGNHCGFTEAFKKGNRDVGGRHGLYRRAETLRKWFGDAGVEVMFGAMGVGAVTENGKVTAVDVATPLGIGRVRAKVFIDATGNADVAAAAGAQTAFFGAREFALQSAGQSPTGSAAAASTRTLDTSMTRTRATCGSSVSVHGLARRTPGTSRRCPIRANGGGSCRTTCSTRRT